MRARTVAKVGLSHGAVLGLAIHWLFWAPLAEEIYGIELPGAVVAGLGSVSALALFAALLTVGIRAVHLSGDGGLTASAGLAAGLAAGLLAGLIVYLIVAVLGTTLVLGGGSLAGRLAEAANLDEAAVRAAVALAAREAAPQSYAMLLGSLVAGGLLGGVEGLVYGQFLHRQLSGCPGAEPPSGAEARDGGTREAEIGSDERVRNAGNRKEKAK